MGLLSKAQQAVLLALVLVIAALAVFGGWNWYRKNVYYTALNNMAAQKVQAAREAEDKLTAKVNDLTHDLMTRSNQRAHALQKQINELATRTPAERIEYRLRDRWLPSACPTGAAPGAEPAQVGGLQLADELFLVRFAAEADDVADERNTCINAYNAARETALKANKK